jgi:hypothetical protein
MKMARSNEFLKAALLACALPTAAGAEDWYPASCLGLDRCARVEAVSWTAPVAGGTAQLVVAAAGTTATVRRTFPTFEVPNDAMHVCMRYDPFGDLEVSCLMLPHLGW